MRGGVKIELHVCCMTTELGKNDKNQIMQQIMIWYNITNVG